MARICKSANLEFAVLPDKWHQGQHQKQGFYQVAPRTVPFWSTFCHAGWAQAEGRNPVHGLEIVDCWTAGRSLCGESKYMYTWRVVNVLSSRHELHEVYASIIVSENVLTF